MNTIIAAVIFGWILLAAFAARHYFNATRKGDEKFVVLIDDLKTTDFDPRNQFISTEQ